MIAQLLTPAHVAILLVIVLLILGPRRLPQAGLALGRSLHEFRQGLAGRDPKGLDPQPDEPDRG